MGDFQFLQYYSIWFCRSHFIFELAPWLLLIVIPALSMRSFSEEIKTGTLELLLSKPVSIRSIVWGKFFAIFFVGFLALLPTLSCIYFVHLLLPDDTTLDKGMLLGGYIGLLLFLAMLAALGVFVSSVSRQQTTAFLVSLFLGFGHFTFGGNSPIHCLVSFGTNGFQLLVCRSIIQVLIAESYRQEISAIL